MKLLASLTLCCLTLATGGIALAESGSPAPTSTDLGRTAVWLDWNPQVDVGALNSCTVSLTCPYNGGTISCSSVNNQCATSPDGNCVVCDGVTQACCDPCNDCLDQCDERLFRCYWRCKYDPVCESGCDDTWMSCLAGCPCP